jgi:hypothetical protein
MLPVDRERSVLQKAKSTPGTVHRLPLFAGMHYDMRLSERARQPVLQAVKAVRTFVSIMSLHLRMSVVVGSDSFSSVGRAPAFVHQTGKLSERDVWIVAI